MQGPEDNSPVETTIAKPVAKRLAGKGRPPARDHTLDALSVAKNGRDAKKEKDKPAKVPSKKRTEPLNFRVTGEFRRAFKRASAAQDCKKVELLERIFNEWSARNPD